MFTKIFNLKRKNTENFSFLVLILMAVILIGPVVKDLGFWSRIITTIVVSFIPFAIIRAAGKDEKERRIAFIMGMIFLVHIWLYALIRIHLIRLFSSLYLVIFYVYPLRIVIKHLVTTRTIKSNTIYAAIAGYILIGLVWASIYMVIDTFKPGSFSNFNGMSDSIYYSFLTLTTLGYGDITPLTALAKRIAVLESMFGVLYNAIVVALIVGIYITERLKKERKEN